MRSQLFYSFHGVSERSWLKLCTIFLPHPKKQKTKLRVTDHRIMFSPWPDWDMLHPNQSYMKHITSFATSAIKNVMGQFFIFCYRTCCKYLPKYCRKKNLRHGSLYQDITRHHPSSILWLKQWLRSSFTFLFAPNVRKTDLLFILLCSLIMSQTHLG